MRVFRLEHEIYKCGPYRLNDEMYDNYHLLDELDSYTDMMCIEHNESDYHKVPQGVRNEDYIFGCSSLHNLKKWFGEYIEVLIEEFGFCIREYEVNDFHAFTNQIAFSRSTSKVIAQHTFS